MLTVTNVWYGYSEHTPVLRGVSFEVQTSGILGILGPNGSGKTTLLRILAGTRHADRGSVTLDGTPLAQLSRASLAARMAVVPQETQIAFDYTVAEVAMMGRYPHLGVFEIEGPSDIAIVEDALASTGTKHLQDRPFATLSGGEKQRVVIAGALAQIADGAGYLLLDEPTASLDLGYQLEIVSLVRRLHDDRGVGIVISTHDLGLAASLCDRIALIRDGGIVALGATDAVLTPDHIRQVYGVDAEILRHPSGHRVVVPIRRVPEGRADA